MPQLRGGESESDDGGCARVPAAGITVSARKRKRTGEENNKEPDAATIEQTPPNDFVLATKDQKEPDTRTRWKAQALCCDEKLARPSAAMMEGLAQALLPWPGLPTPPNTHDVASPSAAMMEGLAQALLPWPGLPTPPNTNDVVLAAVKEPDAATLEQSEALWNDGPCAPALTRSPDRQSAVRCVAVPCVAVRCGAVRCGAVRCCAVRCGAARCGAVLLRQADTGVLEAWMAFWRRTRYGRWLEPEEMVDLNGEVHLDHEMFAAWLKTEAPCAVVLLQYAREIDHEELRAGITPDAIWDLCCPQIQPYPRGRGRPNTSGGARSRQAILTSC
jgi:hypothetical protein